MTVELPQDRPRGAPCLPSQKSRVELLPGVPFLGARPRRNEARIVLFGLPFDGTCSYRPGTRFGPQAIRAVSDALETYCPILDADLEAVPFADIGDLPLPPGDIEAAYVMAQDLAADLISAGQIPAALGGEHSMSLPLVRAVAECYPELAIVQFDAHLDLRNKYLGVKHSHATVMHHIAQVVKPSQILQVGQRSGTREEYERARQYGNPMPPSVSANEIRVWVGDRPLYVTVDIDVLDPSILPGTGTPEPGGVMFATLQDWIIGLKSCRWVGWDLMELSPNYDPTQVSSIVSAKIVRTMLLASSCGST